MGYGSGVAAADSDSLLKILQRVSVLLGRDENDFSWTTWNDSAEALAEVKGAIEVVGHGEFPESVYVWFLPTGNLQEASLRTSWHDEYLLLAAEVDSLWKQRRD